MPEDLVALHCMIAAGATLKLAGRGTAVTSASGPSSSSSVPATALTEALPSSSSSVPVTPLTEALSSSSSAVLAPATALSQASRPGVTPLVLYRYSPDSQSWRTPRRVLLAVRAAAFESRVLGLDSAAGEAGDASIIARTGQGWGGGFLIWGAGRDGSDFFRCLTLAGRQLVRGFVDIDPRKVGSLHPLGNLATGASAAGGKAGVKGRKVGLPIVGAADVVPMSDLEARAASGSAGEPGLPGAPESDARSGASLAASNAAVAEEGASIGSRSIRTMPIAVCVALGRDESGELVENLRLSRRVAGKTMWLIV